MRGWIFVGWLALGVAGCGGGGGGTGSGADGGADAGPVDAGGDAGADAESPGDGGAGDAAPGDAGVDAGDVPDGEPLATTPGEWEFVEIEGAECRDGSTAGIGVNLSTDSPNVMIYLEGGGACFNDACDLTAFDVPFVPPPDGIFNRGRDRNPVQDWSMIYVPYCTGDVHAGSKPDATIEGLDGTHQFVGYDNMGLFLDRIVPTFPDATQVLLTGISAGGFGAAANFERTQRAFGDTPVVLVDDSGPPMPSDVLRPCLQQQWREVWGLEETILADCGADCPDENDYVLDMAVHLMHTLPDNYGGLFSNTRDATIRTFYGYGEDDCDPGAVPMTPGDAFEAGLMDFRDAALAEGPNFGTYYLTGIGHTCLRGPCFYLTEVDGTRLTEWVGDLLEGHAAHVGP